MLFSPARLPRVEGYRTSFRSHDLDETRLYIGDALKPHSLTLTNKAQQLDVQVGRTDFGALSFMYIRHGADVHIYPGKLETLFLLQIPLHAKNHKVRIGDVSIAVKPGLAYMVSPTLDLELRMSRTCDCAVVAINRQALEAFLAQQLQRSLSHPLEFNPLVNLETQGSKELVELLSHFTSQLHQAQSSFELKPLRTHAESLLLSAVLTSLEHNYRDELLSETTQPRPRYIKRAQEFIYENAEQILSPKKVAQEVNVSERSLYSGFKTFLQTTPMEYIKNIRLDRIRQELQQAQNNDFQITRLANKYHFFSLGNFAASYQQRFNELPSDTLRYRRSRPVII